MFVIMSLETSVQWIRDILALRMVRTIECWMKSTITRCEVYPLSSMKDNFASLLFSVDIALQYEDGRQESHALVVKIMVNSPEVRKAMESDKQFSNEIHMYSTIVPLFVGVAEKRFNSSSWFPKCYYSSMGKKNDKLDEEDGIIVLENLKPKLYKLGDRVSLDLNHCLLALHRLGCFHAVSYALKTKDNESFQRNVVAKLEETMFTPDKVSDACEEFRICNLRVIEGLKKLTNRTTEIRTLETKLSDLYMPCLVKPQEPLAVLCHGDFCRNNMLFKYGENNVPCDVKFLDFQTVRYASPTIDLSLFLFLNTTHELREYHWDELFQHYHTALTHSLAQMLEKQVDELDPCYTIEAFKEDFRQYAFYGFCTTILFLPWMLVNEDELAGTVRLWTEDANSAAYRNKLKTLGGDDVTKVLVDLAQEIAERGFM